MPTYADVPKTYQQLVNRPVIEQRLSAEEVKKLRGNLLETILVQSKSESKSIDFNGKVDTATYWTSEKFVKEIAESDKVTYVHWRWEGLLGANNVAGDKFLTDLIRDFPEIDRFVVIELSNYKRHEWEKLVSIPHIYNKSEGPITGAPKGSLFKNRQEYRIRGPPSSDYPYARIKGDINIWLKSNKYISSSRK